MVRNGIQKMFMDDYDTQKEEIIGWSLHGLGRAQQVLKNEDLALGYYFKGLTMARGQSNKILDNDLEMSIAECFLQMNKVDSVIKYGQLCLERASNLKYPLNILGSYAMLAAAYEGKNNDSAVKYYKMEAAMRSKQFSAKNKSEIANLTFLEQERQNEIIAQQNKLRVERNRSLQFASIGIALIAFLMFCLFISQSIIVKSGLVKFLGVLSLLLVFEFVNLWIHPVIGDFTHHSPLWMFLIMVSIAALLVPDRLKYI
jgi:hypothetical protein